MTDRPTFSHEQLHEDIVRVQKTVDEVLDGQDTDRRRVRDLEEFRRATELVLYGDSSSDRVGIVQRTRQAESIIREWQQLRVTLVAFRKALLWCVGALVTIGGPILVHIITTGGL